MSESAVVALRKALKKKSTDKFEFGDVIRWTGSGRFTYVAVKTEGGWFTSARTGNPFVDARFESFEDLIEVLSRSETTNVMVASLWEVVDA